MGAPPEWVELWRGSAASSLPRSPGAEAAQQRQQTESEDEDETASCFESSAEEGCPPTLAEARAAMKALSRLRPIPG